MQRRHAPYTSREPLSLSPFFYSACSCVCTPWLGSSSGHACGRRSNRPRVFHSNYSAPSNYQIASDGVASKRDRGWIPSWSSFTPFASVQPSHRKTLFKIKNRVPLAERERESSAKFFFSHAIPKNSKRFILSSFLPTRSWSWTFLAKSFPSKKRKEKKKKKTGDPFEGGGVVRWTRDKLSRTLGERPRPRWFLNKADGTRKRREGWRKDGEEEDDEGYERWWVGRRGWFFVSRVRILGDRG